MILTGDRPLFPTRIGEKIPCVFDAVDSYLVRRVYPDAVELKEVPDAGHLLLTDAPEPCLVLIRQAIARFAAA